MYKVQITYIHTNTFFTSNCVRVIQAVLKKQKAVLSRDVVCFIDLIFLVLNRKLEVNIMKYCWRQYQRKLFAIGFTVVS